MSHFWAHKQSGLVVVVLALLLTGSESLSYGVGILPPTPCPCAADGVCRPKRDSWGHYETRWRTWPGEPSSQQPTQAEGATPGGDEAHTLPPYETPSPENEDLRGPAKGKAAKSDEDSGAAADAGPEVLLPGPEALPAFDPQGNQIEVPGMPVGPGMPVAPGMNDAPPALPASLRQAVRLLNAPQRISLHQKPTTQPIRPANWQQPTSIQLVNPASAILAEPESGSLQQAIYYEASDQDGNSTTE